MLNWVTRPGLRLYNSCSTLPGSLLTPLPTSAQPWPGVLPVTEPPGLYIGSAGGGDANVERNKKFTSLRGEGSVSGGEIGSRAAVVSSLTVSLGHGETVRSPVGGCRTDQEQSLPSLLPLCRPPPDPVCSQDSTGGGAFLPWSLPCPRPSRGSGPADLTSCSVGLALM